MTTHEGESQAARPILMTQMPDWMDTLRMERAALAAFQDHLPDIMRGASVRAALKDSEATRGTAKRFEERLLSAPDEPSDDLKTLIGSEIFQQHMLSSSHLLMLGVGGFIAGSVVIGGARGYGITASSRSGPGHLNGRWGYTLASLEPNMNFLAGLEYSAWFRTAPPDTPFVGAQINLTNGLGGVARIYFSADKFDPAPMGFSVGVGIALGVLPGGMGLFYGRFSVLSETISPQ